MNMGMPPTREKGSHLPPGTTKLCNLRNCHDSVTAPSVKPDLGSSSQHEGCCSVEPTLSSHPGTPENVTVPHSVGVAQVH